MADKVTVGDYEITAVIDLVPPPRAPAAMFPDVPDNAWADYQETLEDGQLQLYYGVFVVRSANQVVLVDTGMGPGPHPTRGNAVGNLYEELRPIMLPPNVDIHNTNVSPSDQVNYVVHTHLHADHIGWNLRYSGGMPAPNFRRARYIIPKDDYDYFSQPEILAQNPHVQQQIMPLRRLRLQQIVDGEYEVAEGIATLPAVGHTPGHQVVLVNSGGQKAMLVGDVLHCIAQVSEPGWCAAVDYDQAASRASREMLLNRAESEDWIVGAGHFPPGRQIGKVVTADGKRRWQPL